MQPEDLTQCCCMIPERAYDPIGRIDICQRCCLPARPPASPREVVSIDVTRFLDDRRRILHLDAGRSWETREDFEDEEPL